MRLVYAVCALFTMANTGKAKTPALEQIIKERHAQGSVIKPTTAGKKYFERLRSYVESGAYEREILESLKPAYTCLDTAKVPSGKIKAVVFDVDETALSNWPIIQQFQDWQDTGKAHHKSLITYIEAARPCAEASAIVPVHKLYEYARARGYAIFFITGRPMSQHRYTKSTLRRAGYHAWEALFEKTSAERDQKNGVFKPAMRKLITDAGYHIVLNVGDQQSDLTGGYADCTIKLPNPFYETA